MDVWRRAALPETVYPKRSIYSFAEPSRGLGPALDESTTHALSIKQPYKLRHASESIACWVFGSLFGRHMAQ